MRFSFFLYSFVFACLLSGLQAFSNTIHVPLDSSTIQGGINGAANGDTVLVDPNTYVENINFNGKKVTVSSLFLTTGDTSKISSTIIDGGGSAANQSVVTFVSGEDSLTGLIGFTITNGWASGSHGGGITFGNNVHPTIEDCRIVNNSGTTQQFVGLGIYCSASSPKIQRCLIKNNSVTGNGNYDHFGGGIYLAGGSLPVFTDCQIVDNKIGFAGFNRNYGGGIFCDNSSPSFYNCEFSGNTADFGGAIEAVNSSNVIFQNCSFADNHVSSNGGGMYIFNSATVQADSCMFIKNVAGGNGGAIYTIQSGQINVSKSTITDNSAIQGAGIYADAGTSPVATDCIIFYNWPYEIYPDNLTQISYSDIRGGYSGTGNLDIDPLFCDWKSGDYNLAANSLCLSGGFGGSLMGYYGAGCAAVTPQRRRVPTDYLTIQEAIFASYQGDTVLVENGNYSENIDLWGRRILLASNFIDSGDTSDIGQTVIDGGGSSANQSSVSFIRKEDLLSAVIGFTITNGWASGSHGGGMTLKNGARPRIEDCRIVNNGGTTQQFFGIGIYCSNASPQISHCLIKDNTVTGNGNYDHLGGGIYMSVGSAPVFDDCQIVNNEIGFAGFNRNRGGGLYCDSSFPLFSNCNFFGNTADFGGAAQAINSANIIFQNCNFLNNEVQSEGAGIFVFNASIHADSCRFTRNNAHEFGGAIYISQGAQINATHCTMTNNSADFGGGIFASTGTSPKLTDCIIFYNWPSEIYPNDLTQVTYCDVRGGYIGTGNLDIDPLFCDWANGDYTVAANSLCLTSGSDGELVGYFGAGCSAINTQVRMVPQDYGTIQEAILDAYQGDTILVDVGNYHENLDFWGRRVLLTSNYINSGDTTDISQTIIDGGGSTANQSVVSFIRNEDSLSAIIGFTITNGWAGADHGGGLTLKHNSNPKINQCWIFLNSGTNQEVRGVGIYCDASSPNLRSCLVQNNSVTENGNYDHYGGGIYITGSSEPNFLDCKILDNQIAFSIFHRNRGGGVYCAFSAPRFLGCYFSGNIADFGGAIEAVSSPDMIVQNCLFVKNQVRDDGGGIYLGNSNSVVINNTYHKNIAGLNGGAVYCFNSGPVILNTILWEDSASISDNEIAVSGGMPTVTYSDVKGGFTGTGNINTNPQWEDTISYYLASGSPCIDAGNSDPMYNDPEDPANPGNPLFPAMGTLRNDMGAFGGPGTINWVIVGISNEEVIGEVIPQTFDLLQNYPNPFNPTTTIRFGVPKESDVKIELFNIRGQRVSVLLDEKREAGYQSIQFDADQLASGVYFYRLEAGSYVDVKKMILMK